MKFQSSISRKTLENFNLLQQIGYLEDSVIESNGIKNFVQTFDATCHGLHKKTRGRPKRVDIYYDDLKDLERLDDQLMLPPGHGLTFNQILQEEANENQAENPNTAMENYVPTGQFIKYQNKGY